MRNHIWYVTIDDQDDCLLERNRHLRNLTRLQTIARSVDIEVQQIWMANLTDALLEEENLLGLFASGSFSEWFTYDSKPVWAAQLDRYCEQIRTTHVPILAVCGSHQLMMRAFGDWDSVGHMAAAGEEAVSAAEEMRQQRLLIPQPRIGEVGDFPLRICPQQRSDPLLEGLPDPVWLVQYHRDQGMPGRHPAFVPLMEPALDVNPRYHLPDEPARDGRYGHLNPLQPEERCAVQTLRLQAPDRVLYSMQCHPELPALVDSSIDWQSERLLLNFFQIARRYWDQKSV